MLVMLACSVYDTVMIIWFFGFVLLSVLAALAVIDFKTMILPNMLTFPLIFIGLLFAYWQNALLAGVIGTAVGYAGLVALELAYTASGHRRDWARGCQVTGGWRCLVRLVRAIVYFTDR